MKFPHPGLSSWLFVSETLCFETNLFIGPVIAALGGELDTASASMNLTYINIATHTHTTKLSLALTLWCAWSAQEGDTHHPLDISGLRGQRSECLWGGPNKVDWARPMTAWQMEAMQAKERRRWANGDDRCEDINLPLCPRCTSRRGEQSKRGTDEAQ